MKLSELIENLDIIQISGPVSEEIKEIAFNSKKVNSDCLFVALKGHTQDGHKFIPEAISRGARAIIAETLPPSGSPVTWITVPDSRIALGRVAAKFYRDPSLKLKIVGITGTNGKTTISYIMESIFREAGYKPGVIGTINYRFGNTVKQSLNTTPQSLEIQKLLAEMEQEGVSYVAMEVSSHALDQNRVEGVNFTGGVFTNLTPEHLDYHKTMEEYAQCKAKLFSYFLAQSKVGGNKFAVLNQDDPYTDKLIQLTCVPVILYGLKSGRDITIEAVQLSPKGTEGVIKTPQGKINFKSSLVGRFNLYNLMAATGVALCLNIPREAIRAGIEKVTPVPGRMELIEEKKDFTILVDYAHTPDALEKVLLTLREFSPQRIITVFGCGGDRDQKKRPLMGEIAGRLSDLVVITSDNPRTEPPEKIIAEIEEGIKKTGIGEIPLSEKSNHFKGYIAVIDRFEAIKIALQKARKGDIVLVAGKGHENYQIWGEKRLPFDDREQIRKALKEIQCQV